MGAYYDRDQFIGIELPNIYTYINPGASSSRKKRWFPGQFIQRDIDQYNAKVATYNTLLATFNVEKGLYNAKVKENNVKVDPFTATFNPPAVVAIPLRPAAPTQTEEYDGYKFKSTLTYATVTNTKQILLQAEDFPNEN